MRDPIEVIISKIEWKNFVFTLPSELQKICELADMLENT